MDLYFSRLACSMASRIALYEAKGEARYIEVDPKTKRTMNRTAQGAVRPAVQQEGPARQSRAYAE
jgi:hypothetical protein